jgi:hypothetical protein
MNGWFEQLRTGIIRKITELSECGNLLFVLSPSMVPFVVCRASDDSDIWDDLNLPTIFRSRNLFGESGDKGAGDERC